MPCAHTDPPVIMVKAEEWLRQRGVAESEWNGLRIRHAENTPDAPWKSVVIDIERRDGEWIVTQIDRRQATVDEVGLSTV